MYEYIRLISYFKDDDKIVCVNNDHESDILKIGHVYIAVRFNNEVSCVSTMSYHPARFVSLQAYRRIKLKELEKCSK